MFPVFLTDGGSEFSAREEMEEFCDGTKSTTIFYCDPYCFCQKGSCEKNHEYIRYISTANGGIKGATIGVESLLYLSAKY